jgi:hypothetical protein
MFLAIFWSFDMIRYNYLSFDAEVSKSIDIACKAVINVGFFGFDRSFIEEHFWYAFSPLI